MAGAESGGIAVAISVWRVLSGLSRYELFDLTTGEFMRTGNCSARRIVQWADRRATPDECKRLRPVDWDAVVWKEIERHMPLGELLSELIERSKRNR